MHIRLCWTMVPSPVIVEPCTSPVGPHVSISLNSLEMFSHFISNALLSEIVEQTKLYATQCLAAANAQTTWQTSIEELKVYIGFHIIMGVNHLQEIRDYWSLDEKLGNSFIASQIPRDRFEEISRYLHFVDNTGLPLRDEPGYHQLQKVLSILNIIKSKCW